MEKFFRLSKQIMSADKYPSVFSSQMEAIVYTFYVWKFIFTYFPPNYSMFLDVPGFIDALRGIEMTESLKHEMTK